MLTHIPHSSSKINRSDFDHVSNIISENYIGVGSLVKSLQEELNTYSGHSFCRVVNSGSNALLLALLALSKVYPSRKNVITSGYICPAVWHAIRHAGLSAVLVDTNPDNLNISVEDAINHNNINTLCFLVPHNGGIPVDIELFRRKTNIPIIEDCAQAIGAMVNNKPVGAHADILVYSFGSTKMITGGIGGAIQTSEPKYFGFINELLNYEATPDSYMNGVIPDAYNMDLPDLNAGVISSQLYQLPEFVERRRNIAFKYDRLLSGIKEARIIIEPENQMFNRFRYYFFSAKAKQIISNLQANGIQANGSIAHNFSTYLNLGLLNLENLFKQTISVPIYPNLSIEESEYIVKNLRDYV